VEDRQVRALRDKGLIAGEDFERRKTEILAEI
jgi:hypothetical protein